MRGATLPPSAGQYPPSVARAPRGDRSGLAVWLLASLWFLLLFDVQWLLAARGLRVATRAPALLFPALAITLVFAVPNAKEWSRRWTWFAPFVCFIAIAAVTVPFAPNARRAFEGVQTLLLFWTLIVGTVAVTTSARRAELLIVAFALQFFWWGVWGGTTGLVYWSPVLANYDAFGAYMVIGGGLCSFLILGTKKGDRPWLRRVLAATVALCVVGMVASFARGAFLTAFVVAGVVWLRSPRKGRTFLAGLTCVVIVLVASALLFGDAYWDEMSTILEGTEEQTGEDRWAMWGAAFGVFLERPVFGVGLDNWGIFASTHYRPGELGGNYGVNPQWLWGREAHNSYVTILAENGILGLMAFAWLFVDFWKRNAYLRTKAAARAWEEIGGRFSLSPVALGLEAAVVGWMGAAALYSMAGSHWLYTLLAINLAIHSVIVSADRDERRLVGRARRGRHVMPAQAVSVPVSPATYGSSRAPRG